MSEEDNSNKGQCARNAAKTIYFTHLILSTIFTTYILLTFPQVISPTITFIMLMIYGYMLVWVLVLNFIFIVTQILSRSAKNKSQLSALIEF